MRSQFPVLCLGIAWLFFNAEGANAQVEEPSVSELLEQIGGADESVRERAARTLARRDAASLTPADIDALIQAVGNENEAVQEAAVWRLLGIRDGKDRLVLDGVYDKRPKVTKRTKHAYPKEARGIRGRVELQFVVNNSGSVGYVRVLRSIPVLDDAAVECIREWEFEPALHRNRPAPFIMKQSITF